MVTLQDLYKVKNLSDASKMFQECAEKAQSDFSKNTQRFVEFQKYLVTLTINNSKKVSETFIENSKTAFEKTENLFTSLWNK